MDVLDVSGKVGHGVVPGSAEATLVDAAVQLRLGQNLFRFRHLSSRFVLVVQHQVQLQFVVLEGIAGKNTNFDYHTQKLKAIDFFLPNGIQVRLILTLLWWQM